MRPLRTIAARPINLDHPGTYLHYSVFIVSVANLPYRGHDSDLRRRTAPCPSPKAASTRLLRTGKGPFGIKLAPVSPFLSLTPVSRA
jgi:hypothetical protein